MSISHRKLDTSVDTLVEEFEKEWGPDMGGYSRKLVEFCCSKALAIMCGTIDEMIGDGSFSRFTFDMMLAWEMPSSADEESHDVRNFCLIYSRSSLFISMFIELHTNQCISRCIFKLFKRRVSLKQKRRKRFYR